jgi:hypothetical protein
MALGLGACGEPLGPVPVALVLTASDTITVTGGRLQFIVRPVDSTGAVVPGGPILWTVGDTLKGGISVWGVFTARDSGRTWVRARLASPPLAESLTVRIVPPGTVKWTWAATEAGPAGKFPTVGGPALGADGTVYALVETGAFPDWPATLVALSPQGVVQWTRQLQQVAANYPVVAATGGILVVGKHVLLFGADGAPQLDVATDAFAPQFNAGAVAGELAIAAHGSHVTALQLGSGDTVWQSPLDPVDAWLVPPTIAGNSVVYLKKSEDTLFAFRLSDGAILKTFEDPDTGVDKRVFGRGTVPLGNRFYLPTWNRLAAFDTAGPLLWLTDETMPGMSEPAVGSDGMLYVQNGRWGLQAINPDGTTKWYRRPVLPNSGWGTAPRWPWYGGAALAQGGIIYAAGQGAFYAYDVAGTLLWSYTATDSTGMWEPFTGSPAIAPDGTVYSFTPTHLYAFWGPAPPEPNSPWPMWRHDAQRTGWAR